MIRSILFAAVILSPAAVMAQPKALPTAPYLPLELASQAANAAVKACAAQNQNVSVAVVARDGSTKVLLKGDNAGPQTGSASQGKAFAAAALGRDTAAVAAFISSNPANAGMRDLDPRMVIQGGGLPIRIGGALVGGIGVGGAPTGDIDAACALAGLQAIGAQE
ncbi:GlcG/HbpS family heme-binding protein [Kerstersia sp.]|uniref:GlcG/HbpS family heme-binding protein n=1 Tax=Kerstersia sp. TaxID=1930783 RepID=UPI003F91BCDD